MLPWQPIGMVAGILEGRNHRGADPKLPVGGGVRVVCTNEPISLAAHLAPGERLFIVPRMRVKLPLAWGMCPWVVGGAEIHVAASIWPEPLQRWGVWEAEKYFREQVLPLMSGAHNRPDWWWQQPRLWSVA